MQNASVGKSGSYVVVETVNGQFDLYRSNSKPPKETARTLVEKIHTIIQDELPLQPKSALQGLTQTELWDRLKRDAQEIKELYVKKFLSLPPLYKILSILCLEAISSKCTTIDNLVTLKKDTIAQAKSLYYPGNDYSEAAYYVTWVDRCVSYLYTKGFLRKDSIITTDEGIDTQSTLVSWTDKKLPLALIFQLNEKEAHPLLAAVADHRSHFVKVLCLWGFDPNITSASGTTPLLTCLADYTYSGHFEENMSIAKTLLALGANSNAVHPTTGRTPLYCLVRTHLALYSSDGGITYPQDISSAFFELLLSYKADPYYQNIVDDGNTVLHRIAPHYPPRKYHPLWNNCSIKNNLGDTPVDIANKRYYPNNG